MTLSFDMESVAREIDDDMRAAVVKGLEPEDAATAIEKLALSPFTGRVVMIACWDDEKAQGVCLANEGVASAELPAGFKLVPCFDEFEVLTKFWAICSRQKRFASFNGNGFDVPFLVARSLALGVQIHRPLIETKPWEDTHVDLLQKLAPTRNGRASFDIVCRALGVESPKTGFDGAEVGLAWNSGRRAEVAAYCCRDVVALVACLARWDRFALGRREPAAQGVLA